MRHRRFIFCLLASGFWILTCLLSFPVHAQRTNWMPNTDVLFITNAAKTSRISVNGTNVLMSGSAEVIGTNNAVFLAAVTNLPNSASILWSQSGRNWTAALSNTTVTAGNYGSAILVPTNTVDAQGRVTAMGTVPMWSTNVVASSEIIPSVSGNQISAALSNTTVTAGNYGSAISVPTNTVDAKGRVTAMGTIPMWATNVVNSADLQLSVTGNQISGSISNSGVTAGSYGSASLAVTGTVNAAGRWTAIGTVAIVASATNAVSTVGGIGNSSTTNNATTTIYVQGTLAHTNDGAISYIYSTGTGGGDLVKLFETNLAATATSIVLTNLGSGTRLTINILGQSTKAATLDSLHVEYNNDQSTNYYRQYILGNHTSLAGSGVSALTNVLLGDITGGSAPANIAGSIIFDLIGYANGKWCKQGHCQSFAHVGAATTDQYEEKVDHGYSATNAVTSIRLFFQSGESFQTNTHVSVYQWN